MKEEIELNKIYCENNIETMAKMPSNFIDLTVTSPPYDNLRVYNGYCFDFEKTASELFRVTKQGGVVVWVVADQTVKGSETGTSFRQALFFKEIGFNLHDTMIYQKRGLVFPDKIRYNSNFEYMFVFSKGKPKTVNLIKKQNKYQGSFLNVTKIINKKPVRIKKKVNKEGVIGNVWYIGAGYCKSTTDKISFNHPATFPEKLANDHIISWSNENDLVYDPFMGSGTTAKMAIKNKRNYIGSEVSQEYVDIATKRLKFAKFPQQLPLLFS